MKKVIISLILLAIFSCNKKSNSDIYSLTNDSVKYWDVIEKPNFYSKCNSKTFPYYGYYFSKNGEFSFYFYENSTRKAFENNDVVRSNNWRYITERSIEIGENIYEIEKLSNDSFIYFSPLLGRTVLVKSNSQNSSDH